MKNIRNLNFNDAFEFRTSRSGGKGGQNVNKVESKVSLFFDLNKDVLLSEEEKNLIREKLSNRINNDGFLIISSEEERSQLDNKNKVIQKFYDLLEFALKVRKKRKPTRPGKKVKERRLKNKKMLSEKKAERSQKW